MKFLVIGGTGLIGGKVMARLRADGHEALAAAPSTGVDVLSGAGLDAAMAGADTVIDLSNSPSFEDEAVLDFFRRAGRNLLDAEARAGVGHHVALSVVGTHRLADSGYFRGKIAQERAIRESGRRHTIVRSTQFFEFLPGIVQSGADGANVRLPQALIQAIAAEDVAAAVVRIAQQAPADGIVEIAGPEREPMASLAQRFLDSVQDPRTAVADPHARYFGARLDEDTLVPQGEVWLGRLNFDGWLAQSGYAGRVAHA